MPKNFHNACAKPAYSLNQNDMSTKIELYTAVILKDPKTGKIALLKRANTKKLFPNLVTGIGGKVELDHGEGNDLEGSLLRELAEEVSLRPTDINNLRLRLVSTLVRADSIMNLLWLTATLNQSHREFHCTEGTISFCDPDQLDTTHFTPTAKKTIPFICGLSEDDKKVYTSIFDRSETEMTTNQ